MEIYKLTEDEKKMLTSIAHPYAMCGKRVTRPVVIAFDKRTGIIASLNSLTQWRSMLETLPDFKNAYRFELHNLW